MEWKPILTGAWEALRDAAQALWKLISVLVPKLVDFAIWLLEHLADLIKDHGKVATALSVGALSGAAAVALRPPPAPPVPLEAHVPVEVRAPIEAHLVSVGGEQVKVGQSLATLDIPQTLVSSQKEVDSRMAEALKGCVMTEADETHIHDALAQFKTVQDDESALKWPFTAYHGLPDPIEEGDGTKELHQKFDKDYAELMLDLDHLNTDRKPECTSLASLYGAWQSYATQVSGLFPFELDTEIPGAVTDPHPVQQDIGKGTLIARFTPEPTAPPTKSPDRH